MRYNSDNLIPIQLPNWFFKNMSSTSLFRYGISAALLLLILSQVDLSVLLNETFKTNYVLVFFAVLAIIAQIMFLSMRWHSLMNSGRVVVPFKTSLFINLAGYFANILFITSIGGVVAKSGLAIKGGMSVTHSIFIPFFDRFMTLAALIAFTALGLPLLLDIVQNNILRALSLSVVFVISTIALCIIVVRSDLFEKYVLSNEKRSEMLATVKSALRNIPLMISTMLQSIVAQAFFILAVYILSLGMGYEGSAITFVALLPILTLISSLPISFGGWGVREGVFVYGLGLIGFPMESAFLLSLQVGLVTLIAPLLLGVPYLWGRYYVIDTFQTKN